VGTPSKSEIAFWESVRDGDAAGRKSAVASLKADFRNDPSNGYSAFLAASSEFIQGADLLNNLASGEPVSKALALPELALPADTRRLLEQALPLLTDPFCLGIDATLLAVIERQSDAVAAAKTQQLADDNNFVASSVGRATWALVVGNSAGALEIMYDWLKYCSGGVLDYDNPDVDAFVDAANASQLTQRECYSGYYAMHGTEAELLQIGDLYANTGNTRVANLYYAAMRRATNYASWPLKALAERRIDGTQAAVKDDLVGVIACATCHINEVR
jgi:hypothetical protein